MSEPRRTRRPRRGGARTARLETSAGGVVYRRVDGEPRFLLIRDPYANWGLPKGHIEGGETPEEAAVREVAEETGLDSLTMLLQLPTIDWYFRDRGTLIHKFCHFFLFESANGEPVPQADEGITACAWHALPDALATLSYANAREVLRIAGEQLARQSSQQAT